MPAAQHPVFKQPADPSAPIWRYMDFTKFVSMLESSSLFFARADCLDDPFEGSSSRGNELLRPMVNKDLSPEMVEAVSQMRHRQSDLYKWQKQWIFVNCWHMNVGESAAMWKLYAKSNEAVAIKSSFIRLVNELDDKTYVGMVSYIDFERDWLPEENLLYPYVHKRLSFSHEHEVRAVFAPWPINKGGVDRQAIPTASGIEKKVVLSQLIETVYVAPTCPAWFKSLVEKVCKRYDLTRPVVQSSLDAEPFF